MEGFVAGLVKKKISEESERTLSKDSIRLIIAALGILYSEALEKKIVQENPTKAWASSTDRHPNGTRKSSR